MRRLLILGMALSFSAAWAKKTEDEHWKDIGLPFATAEKILNETECYASDLEFFACARAMNALASYETDSRIFVTEEYRKSDTELGSAIQSFGPISMVKPKKSKAKSPSESIKQSRIEKAAIRKSWSDLYKDSKAPKIDFAEVLKYFSKQSYFAEKESAMVAAVVNAVMEVTKDPHTNLIPKAYWDESNTAGASDIVGIGAVLQKTEKGGTDYILVVRPVEDGPALKAGLKAGDLILKVDGQDVVGKSLDAVTEKIRGKEGVEVELEVERGTTTVTLKITRAKITIKNLTYKMVGPKKEVALIKLRSFVEYDSKGNPTSCPEVKAALKSVAASGAKSLVFDIRDNGGGLLSEADCISNAFLELKTGEATVLTKELGTAGRVTRLPTGTPEKVTSLLPMVLLINSGSASASEIMAGALQDYQRAFLVGERTFGKGSVQTLGRFGTGKLPIYEKKTVARFYMPSGRTNQIVGVSPDLEIYSVPNPTVDDKIAFREEDLYAALPAVGSAWKQPRASTVSKLETCVQKTGTAESDLAANASSAIPFDYQQAAAIDAAVCIVTEKLWAATDKRPTFPKDVITEPAAVPATILENLQFHMNL